MRLPLLVCRICGSENDAASELGPGTARPKPGDGNICLNCGELSVYNPDLSLRSPRFDELAAIPSSAFVAIAIIRKRGRYR